MHSSEQKRAASEFNRTYPNVKSSEMSMKMLIAQEMSKEMNTGSSQPNLVAKLMGLDAIPIQRISSSSNQRFVNRADQKDVHEPRRQSWNSTCGRTNEEAENNTRMALVRQKFSEAKRLSTDGTLRNSKQFQDALEVLSSNKDLFLKCLQERTSISSEQLDNFWSVPPPERKRITVLLPSRNQDNRSFPVFNQKSSEIIHRERGLEHCKSAAPPTRIVVLKPDKLSDDKAIGSPRFQQSKQPCDKPKEEDAKGVREHIYTDLGWPCRDKNLISTGLCSDAMVDPRFSDIMSPLSRQSWDYGNKIGSPCSSPSYSQIFYSPDYLVCQEAKKRLSERWATMTYDAASQDRILTRRSSKSLGEMLSLSEARKVVEENSCLDSKAQLIHETKREGDFDESLPRNLVRSNSVPVYSPEFGTNSDVAVKKKIQDNCKDENKTPSVKLSIKGMLSSLFVSRNIVSGLEKPNTRDKNFSFSNEHGNTTDNPCRKPSLPAQKGNIAMLSPLHGSHCENQNQPSPVSVLDPHFGDECMARSLPQYVKHNQRGAKLGLDSYCGSSLIGKSPAIGTVPRTISCDDLSPSSALRCSETRKSNMEPDWMMFATTLLSVSGLQHVTISNFTWHSPESPLDPSIRDTYVDLKDNEVIYEANRRRNRSTRKLVYDCVNTALSHITGSWLDYSNPEKTKRNMESENADSLLGDKVLDIVNSWFSIESRWLSNNDEEDSIIAVEMVAKDEVIGLWWMDHVKTEMNDVKGKIAGTMLMDLMHEVVVELAGRVNSDVYCYW